MSKGTRDARPIEVGDRFETRDKRDLGRVVEVVDVVGDGVFRVRTEAHPRNPDAVGHVSRVSDMTLRGGYKRVSR